jgi:phage I-like protein
MMFLKSCTEFAFDTSIPSAPSEAKTVSDWQLLLPVGKFKTVKYGELNITQEFTNALYENWKNKVMGERQPFIDTDHNLAISNGWIVELRADPDGLRGRIEWTDVGRENVGQKRFKYFSAMIGKHKDVLTGEEHYPVLMAVSLTNTPQMDNMPAVSLNDKGARSAIGAQGDKGQKSVDLKNPRGGLTMDFEELKKLIPELKLSDDQKKEVGKLLGIEQAPAPIAASVKDGEADKQALELTTKVSALELANKTLADSMKGLVEQIQTRNENDLIGLALSEGRILPVDEKKYRELYKKSPDVVGTIIASLPKAIDFKVHGKGGGEGESEYKLSAEDRDAMEVAGMNEDEYREAMGKKKPAANTENK